MKKHITTIVCTAIFAIANMALAVTSADKLPVVKILGSEYYMYESKKGDSLFGIAREFGWDDAKLQELNPDAISPLKKGVKIYYPIAETAHPASSKTSSSAAHSVKESIQSSNVAIPEKYNVKKGETVYSISHKFGIPVEEIYRLNPASRNGIKAGENLILSDGKHTNVSIPDATQSQVQPRTQSDLRPRYYTIKPGDTMYGVAKANETTVSALMTANPGISESNFRSGEKIKLPAPGTGITTVRTTTAEDRINSFEVREVKKNDTWSSIANNENVDVNLLKQSNPGVEKPKDKQMVIIPKVEKVEVESMETYQDPRELSDAGLKEIYEDVHKVADVSETGVKIAIVTESASSKKDLEFVRGFLTGINNLENKHYKVNLKVIDGGQSSVQVLTNLDEFKPNMVFITYDKEIPSYIAEYAEVSQTPVINTFDVKSELYKNNPYLIQLLTPSLEFNESVASNIYSRCGDYTLLFVGEEDTADQLAIALKKEWPASAYKYLPTGSLETMSFQPEGKYIIYGYSTKKAEVEKLLKDISALKQKMPLADINVLGRPNWIVFDSNLSSLLHNADVMIPSRFYLDENSDVAKTFNKEYKNLFNRTPVKSLPLYAGVGYDTATYFISSMAESGNDINTLRPSSDTLQSDFDLMRISNWSGFINPAVYLVRFTPYDTIDKIVIK